jgi:hypothetical protein
MGIVVNNAKTTISNPVGTQFSQLVEKRTWQ